MGKFRKKPVVVDAEQFFAAKVLLPSFRYQSACALNDEGWYVITAHGQRVVLTEGDWIIPEPDGSGFYPVKPDIFEATYEPVED